MCRVRRQFNKELPGKASYIVAWTHYYTITGRWDEM